VRGVEYVCLRGLFVFDGVWHDRWVVEMILSRRKGGTVGGSWDSWGLYIMDDGSECVCVEEELTSRSDAFQNTYL
jgi:hypothetical protein